MVTKIEVKFENEIPNGRFRFSGTALTLPTDLKSLLNTLEFFNFLRLVRADCLFFSVKYVKAKHKLTNTIFEKTSMNRPEKKIVSDEAFALIETGGLANNKTNSKICSLSK